jgi:hypothetical protein
MHQKWIHMVEEGVLVSVGKGFRYLRTNAERQNATRAIHFPCWNQCVFMRNMRVRRWPFSLGLVLRTQTKEPLLV